MELRYIMPINEVSIRSFNTGFADMFFEDEQFADEIDRLVKEFGQNVLNAVKSLKERKDINGDMVDMSKITVRVLLRNDRKIIEMPPTPIEEE